MKPTALAPVLLTIGVVVYLLLTEWTGWKKLAFDEPAQESAAKDETKSAERDDTEPAARASATRAEPQGDPQDNKAREAASGAGDTSADSEPVAKRGPGTTIYRIEQPCDCVAGHEIMLETVEINDEHTVLTFLNARRAELSTYGPGDENAPFLLEWRYVNSSRPRHDLVDVEGIAIYPETSRPLNFKYIFPRIADEAGKFQLSGQATRDLDYLLYTSVKLEDEMSEDELRRLESYKQCGFDGPDALRAGQARIFSAHAAGEELRWQVRGQAELTGDAGATEVTIRGRGKGKAEVCLSHDADGQPCRSCRDLEVIEAASVLEPDIRMTHCGGLPSRPPHWRFAIEDPVEGVEYQWTLPDKARSFADSERAHTLIMAPSRQPGMFEVRVRARYSASETASYTRRFHSVYSCPEPSQ